MSKKTKNNRKNQRATSTATRAAHVANVAKRLNAPPMSYIESLHNLGIEQKGGKLTLFLYEGLPENHTTDCASHKPRLDDVYGAASPSVWTEWEAATEWFFAPMNRSQFSWLFDAAIVSATFDEPGLYEFLNLAPLFLTEEASPQGPTLGGLTHKRRLAVNFLREHCADYRQGNASFGEMERIHKSIADRFPWLADESIKQVNDARDTYVDALVAKKLGFLRDTDVMDPVSLPEPTRLRYRNAALKRIHLASDAYLTSAAGLSGSESKEISLAELMARTPEGSPLFAMMRAMSGNEVSV